jgi:hypothetical protein
VEVERKGIIMRGKEVDKRVVLPLFYAPIQINPWKKVPLFCLD